MVRRMLAGRSRRGFAITTATESIIFSEQRTVEQDRTILDSEIRTNKKHKGGQGYGYNVCTLSMGKGL